MTTILQTSTATEPNRYPEIFDEAVRVYPSAKSILSYGCSEGDELQTMSSHWPGASISGVEILQSAREKAKSRLPDFTILSPGDLASEKFDVIAAMSVLCRWPEVTQPLPFSLFENAINQIDKHLNPGGLLVVCNATYNPLSVLNDYESYQFQPKLDLPANSKSRRIVLPREPDGSPSASPHPVLFRKPITAKPRQRGRTSTRQATVVGKGQAVSIGDRLMREFNHVAETSGLGMENFTKDQMHLIEKVLERQLTFAAEAQQQVSVLQADLGAAFGQIEALKNSTSWRITSPIRALKSALIAGNRGSTSTR